MHVDHRALLHDLFAATTAAAAHVCAQDCYPSRPITQALPHAAAAAPMPSLASLPRRWKEELGAASSIPLEQMSRRGSGLGLNWP
jgi:hypothetical protein